MENREHKNLMAMNLNELMAMYFTDDELRVIVRTTKFFSNETKFNLSVLLLMSRLFPNTVTVVDDPVMAFLFDIICADFAICHDAKKQKSLNS